MLHAFCSFPGLTLLNAKDTATGCPNDALFLKQGEHLMKKGVYRPALFYLTQSLKIKPECKVTFNQFFCVKIWRWNLPHFDFIQVFVFVHDEVLFDEQKQPRTTDTKIIQKKK
jgi:hypothetical protein